MKCFFSLLLAGLLSVPMAGCAASNAAASSPSLDHPSETSSQQEIAAYFSALYQISIDASSDELASLAKEINVLPVQPRPLTSEMRTDREVFEKRIDSVDLTLAELRAQLKESLEENELQPEDFDALQFQCDQLETRVESLQNVLGVVYGTLVSKDAA